SLRPVMSEVFTSFTERREKWYELVDGPLFEMVKAGDREHVDALLQEFLGNTHSIPAYSLSD
ncbi:MAG: hypothetical protein AB8G77_25805, partial [Rhodothermales bacterium]